MRGLLLAALLVAWTWTDDRGVQHWVDDEKKIPARVRAERVELGELADYERLTCMQACPPPAED